MDIKRFLKLQWLKFQDWKTWRMRLRGKQRRRPAPPHTEPRYGFQKVDGSTNLDNSNPLTDEDRHTYGQFMKRVEG